MLKITFMSNVLHNFLNRNYMYIIQKSISTLPIWRMLFNQSLHYILSLQYPRAIRWTSISAIAAQMDYFF